MSDSIFLCQQRREIENRGRFYDWPSVRSAILEAKGAREGVVEDEPQFVPFDAMATAARIVFGNGSSIAVANPGEIRGYEPTLVDSLWSDLQR